MTQSHADHMSALAAATKSALAAAAWTVRKWLPWRSIPPAQALFRWARAWSRWTIITCGAIIAPGAKRLRLQRKQTSMA